MPSEKRKARKQKYFKAVKQSKKYSEGKVLKEDMAGFLLTCNNRERETVIEGYSILNEFADIALGPEAKSENKCDIDDLDDIDDAFDKEKEDLDILKSKRFGERRFQQVESGATNCIFIKTTVEDPVKLVDDIITDISETKTQKARFILRMIPIIGTCKAYERNIEELAEQILSKVVSKDSDFTYSIIFKTRNNNQVSRDDIFRVVGNVVRRQEGKTRVDLKNPNFCVVVEIIRTVCCMGIVRDYFNRKKYNLVELAKPEVEFEKTDIDKKENTILLDSVANNKKEQEKTVVENEDDEKSANSVN